MKKTLRQELLAAIHIRKKEMGLTDAGYRKILRQSVGKRSCKDMSIDELKATANGLRWRQRTMEASGSDTVRKNNLDEVNELLANAARERREMEEKDLGDRPNTFSERPQLQMIGGLLKEADKPWRYAIALAKRMYKKDRLEFCDSEELRGIIAALMTFQKRKRAGGTSERSGANPRED